MATLKRVDRTGSLGKVEPTPQGGIRVPATIARVGILTYHELRDGQFQEVREYNPPEVLERALASLRNSPVTNDHPPEGVHPGNYKETNSGTVAGDAGFTADHIHAVLVIQDGGLIADIEAGKREVSAGYTAEVDYTPGTTPDGQAYDGIRTSIVYNHVAVVDAGRAGPTVRLLLDSARNVTLDQPEPVLLVSEQPATETPSEQESMTIEELKAALAVAQSDLAKANGSVEALTADLTTAKADLAAANDPAKLDALVSARVVLVDSARKVLGAEFKADGLTTAQIHSAVVAKAYPSIKLDGKSVDQVAGMFETAILKDVADVGTEQIRVSLTNPVTDASDGVDLEKARNDMLARNRARAAKK